MTNTARTTALRAFAVPFVATLVMGLSFATVTPAGAATPVVVSDAVPAGCIVGDGEGAAPVCGSTVVMVDLSSDDAFTDYVGDCLVDHGYRGDPTDGAVRISAPASVIDDCQVDATDDVVLAGK